MPIIVAGKLILKPKVREEFIEKSISAMLLARQNKSCEDFSVSPDPIDENRINIFEKWATRAALLEFRDLGPESDIFTLVDAFDIKEYDVIDRL
jgi:quinol monooxygenase YgiN